MSDKLNFFNFNKRESDTTLGFEFSEARLSFNMFGRCSVRKLGLGWVVVICICLLQLLVVLPI